MFYCLWLLLHAITNYSSYNGMINYCTIYCIYLLRLVIEKIELLLQYWSKKMRYYLINFFIIEHIRIHYTTVPYSKLVISI